MAEAASVIAKSVMPSEPAQNTSRSDFSARHPRTQSTESKEDISKPSDTAGKTDEKIPNSQNSNTQPFSKVYQEKLEKNEKQPREEKKQENKQDRMNHFVAGDMVLLSYKADTLKTAQHQKLSKNTPITTENSKPKTALLQKPKSQKSSEKLPAEKLTAKTETLKGTADRTPVQTALKNTASGKEKSAVLPQKSEGQAHPAKSLEETSLSAKSEKLPIGTPAKKETQQIQNAKDTVHSISKEIHNQQAKQTGENPKNPAVMSRDMHTTQITEKNPAPQTAEIIKKTVQQPISEKIQKTESHKDLSKSAISEDKQRSAVSKENTQTRLKVSEASQTEKNTPAFDNSEKKILSHETAWTHADVHRPSLSAHESSLPQGMTSAKAVSGSSSSAQSVSSGMEPLSPAQQILRSIQTDAAGDTRQIQIALSPAGLGMVRIQFQQTGDDISGVLEVQKTETRREIEKSLPQIVAALDSQGLQVRKIDITGMPNSQQKQSGFEGSQDWGLNHEMSEHEQNRQAATGDASPTENSENIIQDLPGLDLKKNTHSHFASENLNLFA